MGWGPQEEASVSIWLLKRTAMLCVDVKKNKTLSFANKDEAKRYAASISLFAFCMGIVDVIFGMIIHDEVLLEKGNETQVALWLWISLEIIMNCGVVFFVSWSQANFILASLGIVNWIMILAGTLIFWFDMGQLTSTTPNFKNVMIVYPVCCMIIIFHAIAFRMQETLRYILRNSKFLKPFMVMDRDFEAGLPLTDFV